MSYLELVITIACIPPPSRGGGRRQPCHGRSRGRCQHGWMGAGVQKLWLIILLLGERQDEKSTPKNHPPKIQNARNLKKI
jgi:hypothetical protein